MLDYFDMNVKSSINHSLNHLLKNLNVKFLLFWGIMRFNSYLYIPAYNMDIAMPYHL